MACPAKAGHARAGDGTLNGIGFAR